MAEPNAIQRDQWNGEGGQRWVADADRRDRVLQPVLDVLLEAAALRPSEQVLDVGCGCGATTIAGHDQVTSGSALGLDLSGPMLRVAMDRTTHLDGIGFVEADAQTHPFDAATDVVISRFGTMFFDNPIAAHANIATAVRPGGRLCIATWQPLEANDWLLVPGAALLRHGTMPANEPGPGMFAQADPSVVSHVLTDAGWSDVQIEPVSVELVLGATPEDATDYLADTGIARRILDTIAPEVRRQALAEVTVVLAAHAATDGVRLGAGINIIRATA